MLRQIIVFTKSPHLKTIQGLKNAASHHNCEVLTVNPFELTTLCKKEGLTSGSSLSFADQKSTLILIRTSGIEFDDSDLHLAEIYQEKGHALACPVSTQMLLRNKNAQSLWLSHNQFPMVPTLLHRGPLTSNELKSLKKKNPSQKFVVKSIRGNKGIGLLKMEESELVSFWQEALKRGDQRYLIQPYFQGRELRHLVLGERHFFIEKVAIENSNEWRRNAEFSKFLALKESPSLSFPKEKLIHQARTIQKKLGLKAFAFDLLEDPKEKGEFLILEINANPGLESASEVFKETDLYNLYIEAIIN